MRPARGLRPALIALAAAGAFAFAIPGAATPAARAFAPLSTVTITQFDDLLPPGAFSPYTAQCVAAGPNGALWVLEDIDQDSGTPAVTEVATSGQRVHSFYYSENSSPSAYDIIAGPDGDLWFGDVDLGAIRRLAPSGGFTEYPVGGSPIALAFGSDGGLWFTWVNTGDAIGRLSPTGQVTTYTQGLSPNPGLTAIAPGADHAMWFTENSANRIGRITLMTHVITEFSYGLTKDAGLAAIAPGPHGALWFTEARGRRVGRITLQGSIFEWAVPSGAAPNQITAGPDGAMWFTEDHPAGIGRISLGGKITEFTGVTPGSAPTCIVEGPDGNMWFTESGVNRMGRVNLR